MPQNDRNLELLQDSDSCLSCVIVTEREEVRADGRFNKTSDSDTRRPQLAFYFLLTVDWFISTLQNQNRGTVLFFFFCNGALINLIICAAEIKS